MKLKIFWISFLIIIFSAPSICFSGPDSKVWESFDKNSIGSWYYNKANLKKSSNIITVWTYVLVLDDVRKDMIEIVKEDDLEKSIKFQNYDHDLDLLELDCKKNLSRVKEIIHYDNKGNVLDNYPSQNSEWKSIPPDSVFDTLYQKLCVTQKKPTKKKK